MISLKPAAREDAHLLTKLHEESFPNYWDIYAFNNFFAAVGTRVFIAKVASGKWQVASKEDNASLTTCPLPLATSVGMIVMQFAYEQAEIITMCVSPAWRKKGVGERLLGEVLALAKKHGVKKLFLDVEEGNAAALALYRKHGFAEINRRRQYYRQKDGSYKDALVMCREIA